MYEALKKLYLDEKLRTKLVKNALSNIKKNHQYKGQAKRWKEALSAQISLS
jgi:spore maturation protein CgeB